MNQAERYMELVAQTEEKMLDSSYHAAFFLLSCEQEIFDVAKCHVSSRGISFNRLRHAVQGFDEASIQMVEIAYNLFKWKEKCSVTPFDISRMGYPHMEQVCSAIYIASGGVKVQIQIAETGEPDLLLDDTPYQRTIEIHHKMEQAQREAGAAGR